MSARRSASRRAAVSPSGFFMVYYKGSDDATSPFSGPRADLGRRAQATDTIIIVVAVIAGLYFGRDVLVPISMAVLLSFVLAPATVALGSPAYWPGRLGAPRGGPGIRYPRWVLGAIIGRQVAQLGENLPEYQIVIAKKLDGGRSSAFGKRVVEKAADALHGLEQ